MSVYQGVRDEITATRKKVEVSTNIKQLAETLKSKVVPEKFDFSKTIKNKIHEKAHSLDQILIELRNPQILKLTKSFTIRRDLKMITYACHHAFLDNRKEINSQDVNYGFEVSLQSWNDILNFVGRKTSEIESCSDAVLRLMNDGKIRSTGEIAEALDQFKAGNISYTLSTLTSKGLLNKLERNQYQK